MLSNHKCESIQQRNADVMSEGCVSTLRKCAVCRRNKVVPQVFVFLPVLESDNKCSDLRTGFLIFLIIKRGENIKDIIKEYMTSVFDEKNKYIRFVQ